MVCSAADPDPSARLTPAAPQRDREGTASLPPDRDDLLAGVGTLAQGGIAVGAAVGLVLAPGVAAHGQHLLLGLGELAGREVGVVAAAGDDPVPAERTAAHRR